MSKVLKTENMLCSNLAGKMVKAGASIEERILEKDFNWRIQK